MKCSHLRRAARSSKINTNQTRAFSMYKQTVFLQGISRHDDDDDDDVLLTPTSVQYICIGSLSLYTLTSFGYSPLLRHPLCPFRSHSFVSRHSCTRCIIFTRVDVYPVTCHPSPPSRPSWKKKPFVGKRAGQLASSILCYVRATHLSRRLIGESHPATALRGSDIIYNIILYYIWGLFPPFVLAAALLLYYVCLCVLLYRITNGSSIEYHATLPKRT